MKFFIAIVLVLSPFALASGTVFAATQVSDAPVQRPVTKPTPYVPTSLIGW